MLHSNRLAVVTQNGETWNGDTYKDRTAAHAAFISTKKSGDLRPR